MQAREAFKPYYEKSAGFIHSAYLQIDQGVRWVYHSKNLHLKAKDLLSQICTGYNQGLRLPHLVQAFNKAEKSKRNNAKAVLLNTAFNNAVLYISPVILYHGVIKPALMPYVENIYEEFGVDVTNLMDTLDVAANLIFTRIAIRQYIDNTVSNLSVTSTIFDIAPTCIYLQGCHCSSLDKIKANLASGIYFVGNVLTAYFVSLIPVVGEYPGFILKIHAYGQCLMEYLYGSLGTCTTDRMKILNENNPYVFGFGASFFTTTQILFWLFSKFSRTESAFIYDAIFSFVFQLYILISLLQDKPLPGTEMGRDIFYYPRLVTSAMMEDGVNWLIPKIEKRQKRAEYSELLNSVANFFMIQGVKKVFFPREFLSLERAVQTNTISLYIDMHQAGIVKMLDEIIAKRGYSGLLSFLPDMVVGNHFKVISKVLDEPGWENTVATIKRLMDLAVRDRKIRERLSVAKTIGLPSAKLVDEVKVNIGSYIHSNYVHDPLSIPEGVASLKSLLTDSTEENYCAEVIPSDEWKDDIQAIDVIARVHEDLVQKGSPNLASVIMDEYEGAKVSTIDLNRALSGLQLNSLFAVAKEEPVKGASVSTSAPTPSSSNTI